MAARVDGVEIIPDPRESLRGFPEDQGTRSRLALDPTLFQASHSRLSTEPSAISAAKPAFSARRPARKSVLFTRRPGTRWSP